MSAGFCSARVGGLKGKAAVLGGVLGGGGTALGPRVGSRRAGLLWLWLSLVDNVATLEESYCYGQHCSDSSH